MVKTFDTCNYGATNILPAVSPKRTSQVLTRHYLPPSIDNSIAKKMTYLAPSVQLMSVSANVKKCLLIRSEFVFKKNMKSS